MKCSIWDKAFVSSVEHKWRCLTQTVAVCQSYNGSQWDPRLERQINMPRQNQIKPCGSWRYTEVLRTVGPCAKKQYKYCSVSCTDWSFRVLRTQCIVTSCRVSFGFVCVCLFVSQAVGPIDSHYMTDRRFELNIFVCVLLKKQSPTSLLPCRGSADKHHIYISGWTIPLKTIEM